HPTSTTLFPYTTLFRSDPARLLQRLVERVVGAQHAQVAVELHPQGGDLGDGLLQALLAAGHAAVVPQDLAQLAVQVVDRAGAARSEEHTSELQSPCNLV